MVEERRIVTVLFADVAGSTALGEILDPEDVRGLLARFYAIAKEVVSEHGGTLEKFIGDAVMTVFGFPQAHGDDAQRALAAALELRDRARADPKLGGRLPVRLGVNTGEVVATVERAAGDFLITGDAVNVAARLQQAAEPWAILCSERTARAARGTVLLGPPTDIPAKGKRLPILARPLLGLAPVAALSRLPLVGREDDLAQLELIGRRVSRERRPFLVSLIAPAGTGKSRLVEEFLARLPTLVPEATVAIAQCLPYGQRLTYWPLQAVLLRLVGMAGEAMPEAVREAIRAWLQARGVESPGRVADLLAATIGAGETEVIDRAALFGAWRTAIEAAARRSPLVLIFEDLHWSSDSLLDLVESIMQPVGDAAVLIVALARPELLDRRPGWGGGRRNYLALTLEPLRDEAIRELIRPLLGGASPEIVGRIVARAEGNPFYAGEIVQSILERVPSLTDPAALGDALATLPDTVQATVLARLDLLPPPERRLLQLGAVFGRSFHAAGIATMAPEVASELNRLMDRLVRKDLIHPLASEHFVFRHILIRDVAYQTLTRAERARLHAAAGHWLTGTAAGREDAYAELIAYHFREAATLASLVEAADLNVSDLLRRHAVPWLKRAGEVATAAAAHLEAARHFRAAIELAQPEDLPELYERLGEVTVGNTSADAYRTALQLCRDADRPPDQALRVLGSLLIRLLRWQATVATRPSDEEIARLRAEGLALVVRARDERAIASFLIATAFYPWWRAPAVTPAELAEGEASGQHGLEIAERLEDANLQSAALDGLHCCARTRGAWEESRELSRKRLAFQDRLDLTERLDAYNMVAWASAFLGDLAEADNSTASALAIVQSGQLPDLALWSTAWRAYTLALLGHWDEVTALGERARELWVEAGRTSIGGALQGFLAALDVARARHDTARVDQYCEILEEVLRQYDVSSPFRRFLPYARPDLDSLEAEAVVGFPSFPPDRLYLIERALSLCVDRDRPPSPGAIEPILKHASTFHLQVLEAQARRALGIARQDPGELARALEIFERIGAVPYAARVRCERGLLTNDRSDRTASIQVLEALGDLDQLDRFQRTQTG
jgi:class 3 adenylate cyclase